MNELSEKVYLLQSDLPKMVLAGPLSKKTTFRLDVNGPWTAKEAKNLLKMISIHIEIMDEAPEKEDSPHPLNELTRVSEDP